MRDCLIAASSGGLLLKYWIPSIVLWIRSIVYTADNGAILYVPLGLINSFGGIVFFGFFSRTRKLTRGFRKISSLIEKSIIILYGESPC